MRILVSKIGGIMYTREALRHVNSSGEMGETEGMIRWLVESGHTVAYFGVVKGTLPTGVLHIEPNLKGLNEFSDKSEIIHQLSPAISAVRRTRPEAYVCMAGYAGTMCAPWNPKRTTVQACGVRYALPQCLIMRHLGIQPIFINCDPRTYPVNQEMTLMWPECKPLALLSQRTRSWDRIVGGMPVRCREVYAAPEHWCYRPAVEVESPNSNDVAIIAHAHMADGIRNAKQRQAVWPNVLDMNTCRERGWTVFGKGWEHYEHYDAEVMPGAINPTQVDAWLASSKCGPITSILHGFYTGKMRTYLMQRCLPLLYGRDALCMYDSDCLYVPRTSNLRFESPAELAHLVDYWCAHDDERECVIDELLVKTAPEWCTLRDCLFDVDQGLPVREPETFFASYGGYR